MFLARVLVVVLGLSAALGCATQAARSERVERDPLPSWKDGPTKAAILTFVDDVATAGGSRFVPPEERVAVFDNDGTLWPENPVPIQLAYVRDRLTKQLAADESLRDDPFARAALDDDLSTLMAGPRHEGLLHVMARTHVGMTTDSFDDQVNAWLRTARHPRFGARYDELAYAPMLELLRLLHERAFQVYIVSGGGADFMRAFSERAYGIPPERVIGSNARTEYQLRDGVPVLVKTSESLFVDDAEGKPVAIHQFIGRRPLLAVGNSDGDAAMLEYTTVANPSTSPRMMVVFRQIGLSSVRETTYFAGAFITSPNGSPGSSGSKASACVT